MRLPDFLVVGAEKCGTTWLHGALRRHPDVFMPETKEIHFFNRAMSNLEERTVFEELGVEWYSRFFAGARRDQTLGEATPLYLCDPAAPDRIRAVLPEARLIAILRDPVDRAFAHFEMASAKGHVADTLASLVSVDDERFVRRGLYGAQITRLVELFGRDSLLVLFYEEVFTDPAAAARSVAGHLGVDPGAMVDVFVAESGRPRNEASAFRSPGLLRMQSATARRLQRSSVGFRIARGVKRSGLADLAKRINARPLGRTPERDAQIARVLVDRYSADAEVLARIIGRPPPWEPVRRGG